MYTKRRHEASYIQDVNGFIKAAKRHGLIKQTKDIYCPYVDCQNRIVDTEFHPVPRTHAASRKGPLDGADLPSFSVGVVNPVQSSREVPVNLTL